MMRTVICGLALLAGSVLAQDISIESSVDNAEITIGDPINFRVVVERSKGIVLDLPGLNVALGPFEIRDYKSEDIEIRDTERVRTVISYVITTYATGDYEIPSLTLRYLTPDSTAASVSSDKIKITVKSVRSSEAEDIRDLKGQAEIRSGRGWLYWTIGLALLLAAGILVYYFYLRKRWMGSGLLFDQKREPPRPAYQVAYEELEELKGEDLPAQDKFREFYFRLSEIIRRYNGSRYGIYTLERTSAEIIADMEERNIQGMHVSLFRKFYDACDMVKFARYVPPAEEAENAFNRAKLIVDETRVLIPEPGAGSTPPAEGAGV